MISVGLVLTGCHSCVFRVSDPLRDATVNKLER
jgi:hypothetical protein